MKLASGCSLSMVQAWLDSAQIAKLATFLRKRHEERFFDPIGCLRNARQSHEGYGFSMMSICCLLVETLECYREGLPTTSCVEWDQLLIIQQNEPVPRQYSLPPQLPTTGREAFRRFFNDHQAFFRGIDGDSFYDNIRNGLLHQAQTKSGWTINVKGSVICDGKNINRNLFAAKLKSCFDSYLRDLSAPERRWTDRLWQNAARKIWWLIRLSKG